MRYETIREVEPPLEPRPYRLRCLTPGCPGMLWTDADDLVSAEERATVHANGSQHRVAIDRLVSEPPA